MSKPMVSEESTSVFLPNRANYNDEWLIHAEWLDSQNKYALTYSPAYDSGRGYFVRPSNLDFNASKEYTSGYYDPWTTQEERILYSLFLHTIISSGDSLV